MTEQKSTDYRGVGQSGFTAGRHEHDRALEQEIQVRNANYPRGADEDQLQQEIETDERYVGRGGPLPPDEEIGHES